jgi:hypothetical protein
LPFFFECNESGPLIPENRALQQPIKLRGEIGADPQLPCNAAARQMNQGASFLVA